MLRFNVRGGKAAHQSPAAPPSVLFLINKHGPFVKYDDAEKEFERLRGVIEAGRRALYAHCCGVVVPEEVTKVLNKFYQEERR